MHKVRPARFLVFISIWSILVYDPVARWSWDADGWSNKLGTMDFAGGTPVHIVSGTTVAAFAVFCAIERQNSLEKLVEEVKIFLGRLSKRIKRPWRKIWRTSLGLVHFGAACFGKRIENGGSQSDHDDGDTQPRVPFEPYNVNYLVLGTALLWFGWAGFNGGSALGGNLRAVSAWTSTHIAACTGGAVGVFLTWYPKTLAWYGDVGREQPFDSLTVLYFCDGAIAGLVAITPAAGYVGSSPTEHERILLIRLGTRLERSYFRCNFGYICSPFEGGGFYFPQRGPTAGFRSPYWRWHSWNASYWSLSQVHHP